ncbi:class I SAM-dependent methyltransferase [Pelotomaculum propionicicum]|uniref:class I SAM-dependent methyltransferase n=1 Tax=Pelotomaculum propionicicum TaxID=258475 RepID=UPI003B7E19D8
MEEKSLPKYLGPDISGKTEKMSREEIKMRFNNEIASLYSQRGAAWLIEFSYAFGLVQQLVEPFIRQCPSILDLGAGTGNLSRAILEKIKSVHMTLMDYSQNMLDEVPKVLAEYRGRYRIVNADFMEHDFGQRNYAAVISSFAIHHCRGDSEYLNLYRKIYGCLVKPGIFVCCDIVAGDNQSLSERNEREWVSYLQDQNFSEQEINRLLSNYRIEDSPVSVRKHIEFLVQAGFDTADVIWKKANFAVYAGVCE